MAFAPLSELKFYFQIFFANKFLRWRTAFLVCLIALVFIASLILNITPAAPALRNAPLKSNFTFKNVDVCASSAGKNNQRTAAIVVLSARHHFLHRNLIRQTYGSVRVANNVRILAVVFLLGSSDGKGTETADDVKKLTDEISQFGDIVMGDFVDSYKNLTLKTIMGYDWLTTHCKQTQFVVKTDDDVAVNVFQLTKEIASWSPAAATSSNIWCAIHRNESMITEVDSRFYASPTDFPTGKFPKHCAGVGYVTVMGVVDRIVNEISKSFTGTVCSHEDVFMTAIVPERINSIPSSIWRTPLEKPIELVNRYYNWIDYFFENRGSDHDHFMKNFTNQTSSERNLNEFRRRYDRKVFYLFAHSDDFSDRYLQFWEILKESFAG